MNIGNFTYKNIYLFGECYFSPDLTEFLKQNLMDLNVENLSISTGSAGNFLTMLRMCHRSLEPGIFFVGGSIHDQWEWRNGEVINDIIKWFDTALIESILVFCLTGPIDDIENRKYNHNHYNDIKKSLANNRNVFCIDLRLDAKEVRPDMIHANITGVENFGRKILDHILELNAKVEKTMEIIPIKRTLEEIDIKEPTPSLFVVHGHNSGLFTVSVNGQMRRSFGFLKLPEKERVGYTIYLDRMMISTYNNLQIGKISFSEPIYVEAIIKNTFPQF